MQAMEKITSHYSVQSVGSGTLWKVEVIRSLKSKKMDTFYYRKSEATFEDLVSRAEARANSVINAAAKRNEQLAARRQERKESNAQAFKSYNVGDILESSWGYEQTNIDFYQIVEKKGTMTLIVREIGQSRSRDGLSWGHYSTVPVKDHFVGEPITIRAGKYLSIENHYAKLWDGNPSKGTDYY